MVAVAALCGVTACRPRLDDDGDRQTLAILLPQSVSIVTPFTRVRSFDDDETPDGLEVLVRPLDGLGDPVKMAGNVMVELYRFTPASGEPKGERIEFWNIPLSTEQDQKTYWNRTTQMYEFRLHLNVRAVPPDRKFVVLVTYTTPLGERMADEHILELPAGEAGLVGRP